MSKDQIKRIKHLQSLCKEFYLMTCICLADARPIYDSITTEYQAISDMRLKLVGVMEELDKLANLIEVEYTA